ncbi:hypothetical protein HPB51_001260 [Rhipicephalus microplus]|uniref:Uncharacterized protein n=1 Tax=Rhipicephalus microplus TaxID=6941 RepID=A0A9J6E4X9_RHIMP|nr:hypothetical protein HPB51_001260 [Rhipicephalus microplus]
MEQSSSDGRPDVTDASVARFEKDCSAATETSYEESRFLLRLFFILSRSVLYPQQGERDKTAVVHRDYNKTARVYLHRVAVRATAFLPRFNEVKFIQQPLKTPSVLSKKTPRKGEGHVTATVIHRAKRLTHAFFTCSHSKDHFPLSGRINHDLDRSWMTYGAVSNAPAARSATACHKAAGQSTFTATSTTNDCVQACRCSCRCCTSRNRYLQLTRAVPHDQAGRLVKCTLTR